jgi:hypothetical protein
MGKTNFLGSLVWGLGRGIGNTASKRTTEYIGGKVINPKSKFRKRIEKFDLGGDFNTAKKKLMVLIEMFHEEYVINMDNLPMMQVGTYLHGDISIIENKLKLFENYIVDPENQQTQYDIVLNFWKSVKSSLNG